MYLLIGPDSLYFQQNQRKVYHEVLITGDLSKEDVDRMNARRGTDWVSHCGYFGLPILTPPKGQTL